MTQRRRLVCPVHVGRQGPLAAIRSAASGDERSSAVVLVGGEAGIGKSRLAGEAVSMARDRGQAALVAGCHATASVPYEPFVELMRRRMRAAGRSELHDLFRGSARLAATLLPEMAEAVEPIRALEMDPHHIDAAVVEVLSRMTDRRRGLLVLEDLHWAGADTVRVLTHLVRGIETLPLWLVATYRDDEVGAQHPLFPLIAESQRQRGCALVHLTTLSRPEVGTMVAAVLDVTAVADDVVAAVAARSSGNPLFIEELCGVLADSGHIAGQAGTWAEPDLSSVTMPISIRESVLSRLRSLDPPFVSLLRIAAVAGEIINPALVASAAEVDVATVEAAARAGIDVELIVERRDGPISVDAFHHALAREALLSDLLGSERREAHRRVAAALAACDGGEGEQAGAIADHYASAGEAEPARRFALLAARHAAHRGAAAECCSRYEQAVRLALGDDVARLAIIVEAAETLRSADPDSAEALLAEGRPLAQRQGDSLALARMLVVEAVMVWWRGDSDRAARAFLHAYDLVRGRGDDWELSILLELARAHANRDEAAAADALLIRGRDLLAAGLGRPRDEVEVLNIHALLGRGDMEREERYAAALAAAERIGDPGVRCVTLADAAFASLWWFGDLHRARVWLAQAVEIASAVRPVNAVAYRAVTAWVDSVAGDHDAAQATAMSVLDGTRSPPSRVMALLALATVHGTRGRWNDAEACAVDSLRLAEATGEPQWIVPALGAVAITRLRDGIDVALPWFRDALRRSGGLQPHWYFSVDLARALFESAAAEKLQQWTRDVAGGAASGVHRHDSAALSVCRGLEAILAKDLEQAAQHLDFALGSYRSMPCLAREAQVHLAIADLEHRRGRRQEGVAAATAARRLGERLQNPGLVAEAAALLRRLGIRSARGRGATVAARVATASSPLSAREREVARLMAQGWSNLEISRRLFVSENTVETHVRHILSKLDFRSRAQVAAWAAAEDLEDHGFP